MKLVTKYGFSASEVELIGKSLRAAADGQFFPDWEFHTLFGMSRKELAAIASRWPANDGDGETERAVFNTVAHLCGYPHGLHDKLDQIGLNETPLRQLTDKLREDDGSLLR